MTGCSQPLNPMSASGLRTQRLGAQWKEKTGWREETEWRLWGDKERGRSVRKEVGERMKIAWREMDEEKVER